MQADREQLTLRLRALAADLDALDRRLSDLVWRQRCQPTGATGPEMSGELSTLETQRTQLTFRLGGLVRELNDLDMVLEGWKDHLPDPAMRVGTCPDCGYPSLDSGLCAFCRPRLTH
jgi:hypothetical protein